MRAALLHLLRCCIAIGAVLVLMAALGAGLSGCGGGDPDDEAGADDCRIYTPSVPGRETAQQRRRHCE